MSICFIRMVYSLLLSDVYFFYQNGFIVCDRVVCLRDAEIPCERLIRRRGYCCKSCDTDTGKTFILMRGG